MNRPPNPGPSRPGRVPWRWIYGKKKSLETSGGANVSKNSKKPAGGQAQRGNSITNAPTDANRQTATARAGIPIHALGDEIDGDLPPPPPPKRRRRVAPKIHSAIVSQWMKKFPGYLLYYHASHPKLENAEHKMNIVIDYLKRIGYTSRSKILAVEEAEYFSVPYENIIKDSIIIEEWPTFAEDLMEDPQEVLNIWGLSMHKVSL